LRFMQSSDAERIPRRSGWSIGNNGRDVFVINALRLSHALTPALSRREREIVVRTRNASQRPAPFLPLPPGEGRGEGV